ncbi:glycosyltransferase family 4 protein [Echinicola jeungdonensis]|uniref:Glycosyltransferase family 4 protein n=1 Tax=Echinicola jeungdonensis TaxID=709343 RepID=A0ABV5J5T2_9BACT|nr:glycosyltransferase family 4 protein [Echinicola jeungdonensis]MDN3667869.1 glycosyltransferase family 4 protein [Echinicola jeungdonensis]
MKIIRIIPLLDFGGVEQRVNLTFHCYGIDSTIDFEILVLGSGGRVAEELKEKGANITILDQAVKIPNVSLIKRITHFLKKSKPDVVHTSGAEANFHGLIAAGLAGVPVRIGEEIGFPNHHSYWKYIFRFTYLWAHQVIGISQSVVDQLVSLKEVHREKTTVVYNPVAIDNTGIKESTKPAANGFTFIITCRLVPVKNLEGLIKVIARINSGFEKGVYLKVVGEGTERGKLKRLTRDLNISNKIEFLGFRDDIAELLSGADAFILPSFSEGFSISLVEAMMAGLPCIATKVGGPSEIIEDGITGWLVDPHNLDDLEAKMKQLIEMPFEERKVLGNKAKEEALKRFSPEKYAADLKELYSSLLERRK